MASALTAALKPRFILVLSSHRLAEIATLRGWTSKTKQTQWAAIAAAT